MADDIVTRLREECDTIHGTKFHAIIGCPPCEAADEIERLRKLTSELAQLMMPFAMLMTNEEQQTVFKAVRGD